jgi:hypothetical protein
MNPFILLILSKMHANFVDISREIVEI